MSRKKAISLLVMIIVLMCMTCLCVDTIMQWVEAYRQHVFCDLLQPGLTRDEVKEVLLQAGAYHWSDDSALPRLSYVTFSNPVLVFVLGRDMMLYFDDQGRLARAARLQAGDYVLGADCGDN